MSRLPPLPGAALRAVLILEWIVAPMLRLTPESSIAHEQVSAQEAFRPTNWVGFGGQPNDRRSTQTNGGRKGNSRQPELLSKIGETQLHKLIGFSIAIAKFGKLQIIGSWRRRPK
jgi:hypothetical protein